MSSRWGSSGSRWSSEREREERERREREFTARDRTRPRRSWREGTSGKTPESQPTPERESPIRPQRSGQSSGTGRDRGAIPEPPAGDEKPSPIGRKWRATAPPPVDEGSALPNLPDDNGGNRRGGRGGTSNRILIFGALLFVLMAVIAFLPFGPLGDNGGEEPTNTPPLAVIPTTASQAADTRNRSGTPQAQRPADSNLVVCIDPGHGGWDYGRQRQPGSDQDFAPPYLNESEINLGMALMLRDQLEARGVNVVLTRETGTAVNIMSEDVNGDGKTLRDSEQDGDRDELQARINICNEANADILISLHLNGFDDSSAHGYEVLYTPYPTREFGNQNLDLATFIYREIGAAYNRVGFETEPRGTKSDEDDLEAELHEFGSEKNLVLTGPEINNPDYTITPSNMPGVIVEPVFITNQEDVDFIVLPENQVVLAEAYAEGIMRYFDRYPG